MKAIKETGTVFVINTQQNIAASQGQSVLEALTDAKFKMNSSCGGNGTCGTCRVLVSSESVIVPKMNDIETEFWSDRGKKAEERLSCQIEVPFNLKVKLPEA